MRLRFRLFIVITLWLASGQICSAEPNQAYATPYRELLAKYVAKGAKDGISGTLVDYARWQRDPLHAEAMKHLQQVDVDALAGKGKMAFWINAYNLLTVDLIVQSHETQSIKNLGTLLKNPWKSHRWELDGREYTLDEIEHKILRPMGDPRIHTAINCASLSCPDLRSEPYDAETLEHQLEEQLESFINNPAKGARVAGSGLEVSMIFKWFAEDFGGERGIADLIRKHVKTPVESVKIEGYLDYHWNLNSK